MFHAIPGERESGMGNPFLTFADRRIMLCSDLVDPATEARQWNRVREILDGALALPPEERPDYVRAAANGDAAIVAEVESLLADADATATWIDGSPLGLRPAPPPDLRAGYRLAQYEILEKLGSGGMGIVYLAKDVRLDRLAALKLLASPIKAPEERRRFAREARAASALNHPNIITIYEYATASGLDFIAMEYVRGTTLAHRLKHDRPPLSQLLEIARQTAVALSRAHAAGIVHRDLKPANIMITGDGSVKVLDFGIAKQSSPTGESSTEGNIIVGTPDYMAPEVALGQPADQRADIFALGVILYEMAAGQRPFQGKDAPSTLTQVMYRELPRVESINPAAPAELGDLIEKCLRKDKGLRLGSMEEAAGALVRITAPPLRTGRRWLLAGASAAAAGAATLALSRWVNGPAARPLSYTLEARKEPSQLPYAASVSDTFQAGWKFRLRLHAARPGYFYVLTETPEEVAVVYPLTGVPAQPLAATVTGWYIFDRNPGLERVWLIWSAQSLPLLDLPGPADASRDLRIRQLLTRLPAGVPGMAGELLQLRHE